MPALFGLALPKSLDFSKRLKQEAPCFVPVEIADILSVLLPNKVQ